MYAQWQDGKIVGHCRWPNEITDQTPVDETCPEWIEYLNRKPPNGKIRIESNLTEDEKSLLIDFYVSNKIISGERAKQMKGE